MNMVFAKELVEMLQCRWAFGDVYGTLICVQ